MAKLDVAPVPVDCSCSVQQLSTTRLRLEHERVGNAIGQSQKPEKMRKLQQWFPDDLDQRIEAARKMHAFHAQPRSSFPKVRSGQASQTPTAPLTMRF